MKKGVPVSPGIAVARAYRLDEALACRVEGPLDAARVAAEVSRFDAAVSAAAAELDAIIDRVRKEVGEEEAAIFRAHRMLLRDQSLADKVKGRIEEQKVNACQALQATLDEYAELFARIADPYLRERLADVRDVIARLTAQIILQDQPLTPPGEEPVILVAPEILPSQAVMFERLAVAGIATETGGSTGHAAILARALGIPAVSGFRGLTAELRSGDMVVIDGREGVLLINPGHEVEAAYRKAQREFFDLRDRLVENRETPAVTPDGDVVELLANVNNPIDAVTAGRVGAVGVGLYRTEYLFLTHPTVPDEEEQYAAYRSVIEAAPGRTVTIRTLDLGGDKHVPYLGTQHEANPFMGWRSVRLTSTYPEFFQTQLRAIFRAAAHGTVRLLFPMVSTFEEIQRLKRVVDRVKIGLSRGGVRHGDDVPVGIMVEVPSAALCIDQMLDEVDFVSIGSNDLIQYVMAADRDNPRVAHLCEPFSPAVFRLLRHVIEACNQRGKPVTLCGEMAGRPRCFLPLFGMGLRRVSMSPAFVPTMKQLVRALTRDAAKEAAERVQRMRTVSEIRGYLTDSVRELCPDITMLDTFK